jgi:uncharacterized protein (DUF1778 family)
MWFVERVESSDMSAIYPQTRSNTVSVRLTAEQRLLLKTAAERAGTTLSGYVRRSALLGAEIELMDRRVIGIPAVAWEE